MPRYHFNVYDGVTLTDQEGTELADIDVARHEGVRLASELLRLGAGREKLGEDWRVEITDGGGMILFRIDIVINAAAAIG